MVKTLGYMHLLSGKCDLHIRIYEDLLVPHHLGEAAQEACRHAG